MDDELLEARMRRGEVFHALRVPAGSFAVVRVDGRSFSALTARRAEKPFDARFHGVMCDAAEGLLRTLEGRYAYTESDEISVLLGREFALFDREVEKLVSIAAARAAATISLALGEVVEVDARVWVGAEESDVVDYFRWRQADAARAGLNTAAYWSLRAAGRTVREATAALVGVRRAGKEALLCEAGVVLDAGWQRRGSGVYMRRVEREGRDPRTGEVRSTSRRVVVVDRELPVGAAYDAFVRARLVPV